MAWMIDVAYDAEQYSKEFDDKLEEVANGKCEGGGMGWGLRDLQFGLYNYLNDATDVMDRLITLFEDNNVHHEYVELCHVPILP